jgi:large repetitive protein
VWVLHTPLAVLSAILGLSASAPARANGDLTRYHPPATMSGLLATDQAEALFPLQLSVSAYLSYAHNPLVWYYNDGTYEPVVDRQLLLEVGGAIGIVRLVDVGVSLPLALYQRASDTAGFGRLSGAAMGDLRIMPRIHLVLERTYGLGLSVVPELTLPTGDRGRFLGDPSVAFKPKVIGTVPLGVVRVIGSVAYRLRQNGTAAGVALGDEMELHAGADVNLEAYSLPMSALLELSASTAAARPFKGDGLSAVEALAGARTRVLNDLLIEAGVGVGLTRGLGTPALRVILGFGFAPLPPDLDKDGIPDAIDNCPTDPEDYDGFQDLDGCPEPDNDKDGILDKDDACPNEAEDIDGFEDLDGCPDHGGLAEPAEPLDTDGDRIPDTKDRCPEEPEDFNGYQDEDGCPEGGVRRTEYIREQRIDIRETVLFDSGKSTILPESKLLLNEVAEQIRSHPEIKRLRIEGHTDNRGAADDNLYLSQDRADAVRRYLTARGVAKDILTAEGYGLTRPIDTNDTAAGRAHNRRVEFVITETE